MRATTSVTDRQSKIVAEARDIHWCCFHGVDCLFGEQFNHHYIDHDSDIIVGCQDQGEKKSPISQKILWTPLTALFEAVRNNRVHIAFHSWFFLEIKWTLC
jgi:hypothetical protein